MGHRRLKVAAISDDEDDDDMLPLTRVTRATSNGDDKANQRKRKGVLEEIEEEEIEELINDAKTKKKKKKSDENEEHEEEEEEEERGRGKRIKKLKKVEEDELEFESEPEPAEEEEETLEDAKPIGEVIRVTGKGKNRRNHYESFEYDGNRYELEDSVLLVAEEDPVLLVPEKKNQKPYVAIIKDITQTKDGNMMVTGQWFYRPEEAQKKTGGNWQSRDARELFYSFHRDEVPAESVMHKCVVHFIPLNKQIPSRKEHPGFIVQKVYDTDLRMLFRLTDKDYEDTKQHEIDLLVQKTMARVGHLPDIETEDNAAPPVGQEDQLKSKRLLRKKSMAALDVTREDDGPTRLGHSKAETPGSCANLEYSPILSKFKVLTGEMQRDRWVEKLMNAVKFLCNHVDSVQNEAKEKECSEGTDPTGNSGSAEHVNKSLENGANGNMFQWPDSVVPAVAALEKAAHEALSSDFQKYNQKMRQLNFNLKYEALARRLLNGELDPSQILNMSPNELKEGLTAEEIASREPEEPEPVQMTDARCKRCTEKKVRLREIIQAGHGDRYQLECIPCGNIWYAPRDEVASLTIDGPNFSKSVGTEPLATAKFEDVEKKLTSPKGANDVLKKTTEAFIPVLDKQRSFNKTKQEDITTSTTNAD